MVVELMKVVLDCDNDIEPEDRRRFEVQGRIFWEEVYEETTKDLLEYGDTPVNVDRLFQANAAKCNVLNRNEYDYYRIDIDKDGTVFTIKCRLKDR